MKELANLNLFIVGNASQEAPARGFMTYDVVAQKAKKTGIVYTIASIDPLLSIEDLWAASITAIKTNEGIA